jgi:hypothetical protein
MTLPRTPLPPVITAVCPCMSKKEKRFIAHSSYLL